MNTDVLFEVFSEFGTVSKVDYEIQGDFENSVRRVLLEVSVAEKIKYSPLIAVFGRNEGIGDHVRTLPSLFEVWGGRACSPILPPLSSSAGTGVAGPLVNRCPGAIAASCCCR